MAQPKMQQEPTMEEILASIRRIIDSGEEQGAAERGLRSSRYDDEGASGATQPSTSAEEGNWHEPVVRDPVVVSHTGTSEMPHHAEAGDDQPDEPQQAEAVRAEAAEPPQEVYPGSLSEVAAQVRAASAEPDDEDEALLSVDTEKRIGEALRELSVALEREGTRSIEEIVAEELRPLLRAWLDTHMPSIVETMVAKEIERMRKR